MAMATNGRGWPWEMLQLDIHGNFRNCRGRPRYSLVIDAFPWQWPRMAVEIPLQFPRKLPWQLPPTSVGCHDWYDGVCHGQNYGTCSGHPRGIFRGRNMSRGTRRGKARIRPWQHPRKSTGVPRLLPWTSVQNLNIMQPWWTFGVRPCICVSPPTTEPRQLVRVLWEKPG